MKKNKICACDFETTTDEKDCRVWAWGAVDLETGVFSYGNSIETFFEYAIKQRKLYFHNLAFDGEFIIDFLFQIMPYDDELTLDECFSTIITDRGQWYSIDIKYRGKHIKIWDSLKLLPMSIEQMAKSFNMPFKKLKLDYNSYRDKGHIITEKEQEYLKYDVLILAEGLNFMLENGNKKITIGSNALYNYKKIVGKSRFTHTFPPPVLYDADLRSAYKGGYTYVNPKFQNKNIGEGIVLDVNSLYPYIMYDRYLPYGEGIYFKGEYVFDEKYPLYIIKLYCSFELKPNHLPTIQLKNNFNFSQHEYLTTSKGEIVILNLTNIDYELLEEHYHVENKVICGGWKFKAQKGMFKDYIDKWNEEKRKATEENNAGKRLLSKLMLNNLYGKFSTNSKRGRKIPYLDTDGEVKFLPPVTETGKLVYIPVGIFITSYAREYTIRSAQKNIERFCYADTDSLHLVGRDIPKDLTVHKTQLGAWKIETEFTRAKFVKQKTYIEEIKQTIQYHYKISGKKEKMKKKLKRKNPSYYLKITCAGMPNRCYKYVTFDNFKQGTIYNGKLRRKRVKGGVVLLESTHEIK